MPLFLPDQHSVTDSAPTEPTPVSPASPAPPLSLYVHIPWCIKKCPYCDFNSHEKNDRFDEQRYVDALITDLDNEYAYCQHSGDERSLQSIFFGGGTPSLFSARSIQRVIDHARSRFGFEDIEITLEANPGTFEQDKFSDYRKSGVNRLSIGIQSFNAEHLAKLGRVHDDRQARDAVETAFSSGFENINLDLMFGLPGQSIEQAMEDIRTACSFQVPHLSHYQLTIEENTYFHKHRPILPGNDTIWEMQTRCQSILTAGDYQQYEVSAYARNGADNRSQHNLNYWRFGDYIGIGAGAHGKSSRSWKAASRPEITRRWKQRQPQRYMESISAGDGLSGQQQLDEQAIVFEFLLNALRLKDGCDMADFEKHTGLPAVSLISQTGHIDRTLLQIDSGRIRTTEKGYLFLNEILEQLILDEDS